MVCLTIKFKIQFSKGVPWSAHSPSIALTWGAGPVETTQTVLQIRFGLTPEHASCRFVCLDAYGAPFSPEHGDLSCGAVKMFKLVTLLHEVLENCEVSSCWKGSTTCRLCRFREKKRGVMMLADMFTVRMRCPR
uniref:Uncharacterized protein n=1 Tax=Physcomitrium patens TaxID=3218 RepID=A0A2K1KFX2_PHYPA|nr:hypothetical protein PHYPA_009037 [Physcomitrium patens]